MSPVYQELHRHTFAGDDDRGVCLLLTGRLFHHHFSAAVTVSADHDQDDAVIVDFDVADRCRADVSSLAATYLVAPRLQRAARRRLAVDRLDRRTDRRRRPDVAVGSRRDPGAGGSGPTEHPGAGARPSRPRLVHPPAPLPLAVGRRPPIPGEPGKPRTSPRRAGIRAGRRDGRRSMPAGAPTTWSAPWRIASAARSGVGHRVVPGFEAVAAVEVGADELGGRPVEVDMVGEPPEPIVDPLGVVRAPRAVERQAPPRPEPERPSAPADR